MEKVKGVKDNTREEDKENMWLVILFGEFEIYHIFYTIYSHHYQALQLRIMAQEWRKWKDF